MGPMTGRGLGYCAGYNAPGYVNGMPGRGFGLGRGRGFGRGLGLGLGFRGGRGRGWQPQSMPAPARPTMEQEADSLKGHIKYLEDALENIRQRLAELQSRES